MSWTEIISCTILHSEKILEIHLPISIDKVRGTVVVAFSKFMPLIFDFSAT